MYTSFSMKSHGISPTTCINVIRLSGPSIPHSDPEGRNYFSFKCLQPVWSAIVPLRRASLHLTGSELPVWPINSHLQILNRDRKRHTTCCRCNNDPRKYPNPDICFTVRCHVFVLTSLQHDNMIIMYRRHDNMFHSSTHMNVY